MATVGEILGIVKLRGGPQFVRDFRSMTNQMKNEVANLRTVVKGIIGGFVVRDLNQEFLALEAANRKLIGTSKLTDQSLKVMQQTADDVEESLGLNTIQANEFTTALTKLGAKSGDVTKTREAITRLLDIASARGLTAEEALVAINHAILGIDEGTDKLFDKNPSVIYAEFAKQIGVSAAKLTDQQKAQALLNDPVVGQIYLGGKRVSAA